MKKKDFIGSLSKWFHSIFSETPMSYYNFNLENTTNPIINNSDLKDENNNLTLENQSIDLPAKREKIYTLLDLNLEYMKVKYNSLINSDVEIREFILNARNKQYRAFLMYIDGMVNSNVLNNYVIKPLMLKNSANSYDGNQNRVISEVVSNNITVRKVKKFDITEYIFSCLIPQNSIKKTSNFEDLVSAINAGDCALFIDSLDIAFDISVKGFEQRSLAKPENEMIVRGEQVAFTESLRTNTSLIRRYINNENLIIESTSVGSLSKTSCAICYLKNVANSDLIAEVKYRINNLKVDYIISSGQLEQLIQDNGNIALPQIISTERPDKVVNYLFGGRVAIIVNRFSFCFSCSTEYCQIFLLLLKI